MTTSVRLHFLTMIDLHNRNSVLCEEWIEPVDTVEHRAWSIANLEHIHLWNINCKFTRLRYLDAGRS